MIESQIRELFTQIAGGEPHSSRVDVQLARRRGRARLRWRRAGLTGTAVLAAAAITVGATTAWSGSARPAAGLPPASAPLKFNPLVPYLSFGWLPSGNRLLYGGTSSNMLYLLAGPKIASNDTFNLVVYASGQCQLTGKAKEIKCSTPALDGLIARITGSAPAVRGRRAYWGREYEPGAPLPAAGHSPVGHSPSGQLGAGRYLIWPYANGGWASLSLPDPASAAAKRDAVKIADNVRYGAPTPPLMFPMQLKNVPSKWRVGSVYYLPDGQVRRASRFAVSTGNPNLGADGGLQFQKGLPYFPDIESAPSHNNYCGQPPTQVINGYHVVLGDIHGDEYLCAGHADGLEFQIDQQGAHPPISVASLFRYHLRLLGTNPANWTRKPIG